jgi:hypothetical protein
MVFPVEFVRTSVRHQMPASVSSSEPAAPKAPRFHLSYRRILCLFFALSLPVLNPIVHGDGVGYYAYARAVLIQHNLRFEEDWRHGNLNFAQSRTSDGVQLLPQEYTETGYVSNLFSVGPAILWSPFLLLAHLFVLTYDFLGGHIPANGFSFPYLLAMAIGTAIYGFLGLLLAFSLSSKYVDEKWAFLATLGVWFGSSLPVYMYFNPAWSHAHSAFVVALFLWYWERTRPARSTAQWVLLGLIAGLMTDVYFPNGVFLLLPLIESLLAYASIRTTGIRAACQLFLQNLLFLLSIIVATIPTYVTRKIIFGGYLSFGSYPHLPWDWSAPNWWSVLFSSDHGLVSWTPLLGLALFGLLFHPRQARTLTLYLASGVIAFYYLISSYPYWDGLSSFGNRFFISLTPIFVFGLAPLFAAVARRFSSQRNSFILLAALLACFVCWNIGFMFQWGAHLIPVRGPISWNNMVHNQFAVVPREISSQLRVYLFRRHALMQEIEQRDIEQLKRSAQPTVSR